MIDILKDLWCQVWHGKNRVVIKVRKKFIKKLARELVFWMKENDWRIDEEAEKELRCFLEESLRTVLGDCFKDLGYPEP